MLPEVDVVPRVDDPEVVVEVLIIIVVSSFVGKNICPEFSDLGSVSFVDV